MTNWTFAVRALRSRNYRLFFTGQSVSLIGTWMTRVATGWLVYRLTGDAVLLGIVSFAGQAPAFFLAPLAGVLVDRWDRHRTLVVTQILSMLHSFAIGGLALTGIITVWQIALLALFQGFINAFDMPARQAFVVQMVNGREDLGNAIALNSSMVNAARLVGPALAGVIIAAVGEAYCFLLDGVSYLAVIASLLLMRIDVQQTRQTSGAVLQQLNEGWRYVAGSVPIRSILLLLGLASLAGMPYTVLMPIIASDVLHGGPNTLGILMAASGLGALAGAVTLAVRRTVLGLGTRIVVCSCLFGA
ncbi:MAG: MFS transporter, partial [Bryobacteraceae bacterium]